LKTTPTINKLVSANSLSLLPLLRIESEWGLPFSGKSPIWVANGNEAEHFLRVIEKMNQNSTV